MSQALRRLGCSVTILQKASQLAEREDPDVADTLRAALTEDVAKYGSMQIYGRLSPYRSLRGTARE